MNDKSVEERIVKFTSYRTFTGLRACAPQNALGLGFGLKVLCRITLTLCDTKRGGWGGNEQGLACYRVNNVSHKCKQARGGVGFAAKVFEFGDRPRGLLLECSQIYQKIWGKRVTLIGGY
jgi:hypothetical protein